MAPRFRLGRLVATPGALDVLKQADISPLVLIARHAAGNWGELCDEDKAANDRALNDGSRLLSAYTLADKAKVWVITEAADDNGDRSCTTLLLPQEY